MLYVHEDVPDAVSGLFLPKEQEYMNVLHRLYQKFLDPPSPGQMTGFGQCEAVSSTVALALKYRGKNVGLVHGTTRPANSELPVGHWWIEIDGYSADLTNVQTGSDYMMKIIPSSMETEQNLMRAGVYREIPEMLTRMMEYYGLHGRPIQDLFNLFRNE
ncbi:MAG: hypothetical protein J4431_04295 [Candidatus Aenigmarchaeota archaeon]|nr:hypothetical protein [Candidatus Aenigmarchaeota archaeon]